MTYYKVPYVILISKMIEHFRVDLEGELIETVKTHNEITCATLQKIELKRINGDF